jgi:hypothetical protein
MAAVVIKCLPGHLLQGDERVLCVRPNAYDKPIPKCAKGRPSANVTYTHNDIGCETLTNVSGSVTYSSKPANNHGLNS